MVTVRREHASLQILRRSSGANRGKRWKCVGSRGLMGLWGVCEVDMAGLGGGDGGNNRFKGVSQPHCEEGA